MPDRALRPRPRRSPGRWLLLAVGRLLPTTICPLCACLVAADGEAAHARWHRRPE